MSRSLIIAVSLAISIPGAANHSTCYMLHKHCDHNDKMQVFIDHDFNPLAPSFKFQLPAWSLTENKALLTLTGTCKSTSNLHILWTVHWILRIKTTCGVDWSKVAYLWDGLYFWTYKTLQFWYYSVTLKYGYRICQRMLSLLKRCPLVRGSITCIHVTCCQELCPF